MYLSTWKTPLNRKREIKLLNYYFIQSIILIKHAVKEKYMQGKKILSIRIENLISIQPLTLSRWKLNRQLWQFHNKDHLIPYTRKCCQMNRSRALHALCQFNSINSWSLQMHVCMRCRKNAIDFKVKLMRKLVIFVLS